MHILQISEQRPRERLPLSQATQGAGGRGDLVAKAGSHKRDTDRSLGLQAQTGRGAGGLLGN